MKYFGLLIPVFLCGLAAGQEDGPGQIVAIPGHEKHTFCLAFAPDGRSLLTAGRIEGEISAARLWDVGTGRELATFEGREKSGIYSVEFAPDGQSFATAGADGAVQIRRLDGTLLATLPHPKPASRAVFSPDGRLLASCCTFDDPTVRIWDVSTREVVRNLVGHSDRIRDVAFSPDGQTLISASRDGTARLWDVQTGRSRIELGGLQDGAGAVEFSPDGSLIAVGCDQGEIRLCDPSDGAVRQVIPLRSNDQVFSSDGQSLFATGFDDNRVHVYAIPSGWERASYPSGLDGRFAGIAASPDGRSVAWCGEGKPGGNVRLLRLPAPSPQPDR